MCLEKPSCAFPAALSGICAFFADAFRFFENSGCPYTKKQTSIPTAFPRICETVLTRQLPDFLKMIEKIMLSMNTKKRSYSNSQLHAPEICPIANRMDDAAAANQKGDFCMARSKKKPRHAISSPNARMITCTTRNGIFSNVSIPSTRPITCLLNPPLKRRSPNSMGTIAVTTGSSTQTSTPGFFKSPGKLLN